MRLIVVLLACLALSGAPACSLLAAVDQSAEKAADAVDAAGHALALLDAAVSGYVDGLPSEADLADAVAMVGYERDARASLGEAIADTKSGDLGKAREAIGAAILSLTSATTLLEKHGVDVTNLKRAIESAQLLLTKVP